MVRQPNVVLVDDRREVDYCVAPPDLLEELGRGAQDHASEMLRFAIGGEVRQFLLAFHCEEGLLDNACLEDRLLGVERGVGEGGYDALAFVVETLGDEPSWGFREQQDTGDEEDDEDELEGDWDAP